MTLESLVNKMHEKKVMMIPGSKRKVGPQKNGDSGDENDVIGRTRTTTHRHREKIYPGMSWRLRTSKSYQMKFLAGCFFDEPT